MQSVLLTAFCATMARRLRQDRVLIALMAGNRVDPRMETWSARSTISSRCSSIGRSPTTSARSRGTPTCAHSAPTGTGASMSTKRRKWSPLRDQRARRGFRLRLQLPAGQAASGPRPPWRRPRRLARRRSLRRTATAISTVFPDRLHRRSLVPHHRPAGPEGLGRRRFRQRHHGVSRGVPRHADGGNPSGGGVSS